MNKPPSRTKYEQTHPVIAFRVTQELFDRIEEAKLVANVSYARLMEIGASLQQAASDEGLRQGFAEAKNMYCVVYPCGICGKQIEVHSDEEKEFCRDAMKQGQWKHNNCHEEGR